MKYRREIDGLRAIAVLPVIFFHAGFSAFAGGFVGVDIFFVISGYLITTIIINEIEEKRYSTVQFYERRARRILPALFFVMFLTVPLAWLWLLPHEMRDFAQSLIGVTTFSSNILFWKETGYFETSAETKPLLHTWSLAVEEQFYILFPPLLAAVWKLGGRWAAITISALFCVSLGVAEIGSAKAPAAAFYLLPARIWELLIGTFAAIAIRNRSASIPQKSTAEIGSMIGMTLIAGSIFLFDKSTPFPSAYALLPTVGALLVILFTNPNTLVGKILGHRVLVGIGLISYSAYLWHQPIFAFARIAPTQKVGQPTFAALSLLTFVLAYFSWKFIESPFRNKKQTSPKAVLFLSTSGAALFLTIGTYGHISDGNIGRYEKDVTEYFQTKNASDEFVWSEKNKTRGLQFAASKKKILVIGDSNSGDLLNTLKATPRANQISFSSLKISVGCGNLFLSREIFNHLIEKEKLSTCSDNDDLTSAKNRELIAAADLVFFASNWREWEAKLIQDSHERLKSDFGEKFIFFGSKKTDLAPEKHVRQYRNAKFARTARATEENIRINNMMARSLSSNFIDPYKILCKNSQCPTYSPKGDLIQYDGFHFTERGAEIFAEKLATHTPRLEAIFSASSNTTEHIEETLKRTSGSTALDPW